ncbi:MAG: GNAT family N-acetyltransferase [Saprospiraceae bacterium]
MVEIKQCKDYNPGQLEQIIELMSQLCPECPAMTRDHFDQLLNHATTKLFIAMDQGQILGSLTLAWYPVPTTIRAWIEDVVVDKNHRGKKIGEALILHAIEEAKRSGIKQVDLTSRPDRIEANKLYLKLGFQKRETNAYRLYIN